MSDQHGSRPTFIKATNVKGLTMNDNVVSGDVNFADLDNVEDVHSSGNIQINPVAPVSGRPKAWYERPIGLIAIGLFIAVIAGGILHALGWV